MYIYTRTHTRYPKKPIYLYNTDNTHVDEKI